MKSSFKALLAHPSTRLPQLYFFFLNDTATTEIYTLSLHDALPIFARPTARPITRSCERVQSAPRCSELRQDRKSTRLNSSHGYISYAVFCLKKKKNPLISICYQKNKRTDTLYR